MYPPLVVLTDFSAVANRGLSYAAALALHLKTHLVLLHVRHDALLAPDEHSRRANRPAARQTEQALLDLAADQPVRTEVDISEQTLPDAVQHAVRLHHPLLLVLGRPGPATDPEQTVTSTVMHLLRDALYPLLVVPTVGRDAFPPRRLLLAVDGEPFSLYPSENVLRRLLSVTKGSLDVVQVTDDQHARHDPLAVLSSIRVNEIVDSLPSNRLHQVYQSTVVEGVLREAARLEADLLVVVARRHSLLGGLFHRSVTAQLIQQSPIPVLLLPADN